MKVIKNINNNVSLCLDSQNREVIAFGKGIGFTKPPYEIPLKSIERTFYNVDDSYVSILGTIPKEIIDLTIEIVDTATSEYGLQIPSSKIMPIADHIVFALDRKKMDIQIDLPMREALKQSHPNELNMAKICLNIIENKLGIRLPDDEIPFFAFHFINFNSDDYIVKNDSELINECVKIAETLFNFHIDKKSISYSRFVTHIYYLIERARKKELISSKNGEMYQKMKENFPDTHKCALQINDLFKSKENIEFSNEEILYLMLHINRIIIREDCYL